MLKPSAARAQRTRTRRADRCRRDRRLRACTASPVVQSMKVVGLPGGTRGSRAGRDGATNCQGVHHPLVEIATGHAAVAATVARRRKSRRRHHRAAHARAAQPEALREPSELVHVEQTVAVAIVRLQHLHGLAGGTVDAEGVERVAQLTVVELAGAVAIELPEGGHDALVELAAVALHRHHMPPPMLGASSRLARPANSYTSSRPLPSWSYACTTCRARCGAVAQAPRVPRAAL